MSLLYPDFLLALTALAIPIIIHLFNFRRFKKVVFPNVRFLKEVDLKTRSKNRLKHLLILLTRLLALAALVFAFARPYLPAEGDDEVVDENHVAIYVDNSYSMNLENEDGQLLQQALKAAEDISASYSSNDRFLLLTNDLKPEHQRLLSQDEFAEQLSNVKQSSSTRKLSDIYARGSDLLSREGGAGRQLFMLSDFQSGSFDPEALKVDTVLNTRIIPMAHLGQGNVYVDSVWFETPVRSDHIPERLGVRVVNASGKDLIDIPVRLTVNGAQKALTNMTLKPFSSVDSVITYSNNGAGWKRAKVTIADHPITFDDALHFAYEVKASNSIAVLGEAEARGKVERIFQNDPFYKAIGSDLRQFDLATLRSTDLVVLADISDISSGMVKALSGFVDGGGSLCVIPGEAAKRNALNELLLAIGANSIQSLSTQPKKVADLDLEHPMFKDVFDQRPRNVAYPDVNIHFEFARRVSSSEERLMSLQGGSSFLSRYSKGRGQSYVFASSLSPEASSLASHSLFITSLLRMAEMSAGRADIYHSIGKDAVVSLQMGEQASDAIFEFSHELGQFSFIPEQRTLGSETLFFDRGQVQDAGTYTVQTEGTQLAEVAYNYDREESEMAFEDATSIQAGLERNGILGFQVLADLELDSGSFGASLAGTPLWRFFIIAVLVFLAIEVLLIKFWK